jgi:hypothetical protein
LLIFHVLEKQRLLALIQIWLDSSEQQALLFQDMEDEQ